MSLNKAVLLSQQVAGRAQGGRKKGLLQAVLGLACVFGLCSGCDRGPQMYEVTGRITYEGKEVPAGRIVFTPDHTKGNSGAQGVARVNAGELKTEPERQVVGGPHWIQLLAYDGVAYEDREGVMPQGRALFPLTQVAVDLPLADAKLDIRVTPGATEPQVEVSVE